jgi:sec-independent protein translocase protein TatC
VEDVTVSAPAEAPAPWDQKEMSFTEHLRELRKRLLIAVATVGLLAAVLFWPSQFAIAWMEQHYFPGIELNAFAPADVIYTEFRFSLYGAVVFGLPVILYQIWMFIVPAFHPRTRRLVYVYTAPSLILALAGMAFAHFLVLPHVIVALLAMTGHVAKATFGLQSSIDFILMMLLIFALVFQTPVVMVALARIGIVDSTKLRKWRKFALFGCFAIGAVAAPDGSPLSMTLIGGPMYLLYEVGLAVIRVLEKSWRASASPY